MPLAIELAAARTNLLSLSQIEARLNDRFQLLSGGPTTLPRHQTLRATIEWSHDLLSEPEKILFRRLSVFAGGWTLEAVESVCRNDTTPSPSPRQGGGVGPDILGLFAQLVNKSLIVVERGADDEVRYRMLETIREYAGEQLRAAGEMEELHTRHFDFFLQMAQLGEPRLFTPESSIDWAETEIDNLRAALTWALEVKTDSDSAQERTGQALELIAHVWPLWYNRGYSMEGSEWLNQLLSVHTAPTPARARALLIASDFASFRGDYSQQAALIHESMALAQKLGDKKRIADSLMQLGLVERDQHYPEAVRFLSESLGIFRELKEDLWVYRTSFLLADTHLAHGNLEAAKSFWEQGLSMCRAENDKFHIAWGLEGLGNLERLKGHLEQARQLYTESLNLKVSITDKAGITHSLAVFAQLAAAQNHFKQAATLWGAAEQLRQSLHLLPFTAKEQLFTSWIPEARAKLGEETFAAAWNQGRMMKMHQAVEYALSF
jgi:non-specific serine/threonine protein kinase